MANGKPLGDVIIKLNLDSSAFSKGLTGAKNAVNHQMKAMKSQMQVMNSSGNSLGALQAKYNGLGGVLQANEKQVALLTKAYKDSFDSSGNATASTAKYANQLNQATARSVSYESQMKKTVGQIARMKVETEGATGDLKKQSDEWIRSGKKIETFGSKVSSAGTALTIGVTAPLVAGATAVTTAAISWESAFAGVKKTNDEVVDSNGNVVYSYSDLEKGLRNLATQLPASHQEIANVAEAAGQLGIKTENVVSFTKTMIDMGESTNMSAETAATSLARLANITKLPQDKFSNLGAAIVDLGNNFATTESEITEMALRLAGAGSQIGLNQGDILGLAASLSSVGIEAEMGGSAISKIMVNMQVAAKTGLGQMEELSSKTGMTRRELELMSSNNSKGFKELADSIGMTTSEMTSIMKASSNLEDFGKIAGMSAKDFKKAFEEDAIGAIGKFVDGLGHASEKGTTAIEMLDEMGIKEVRLRDSLLRAGNASDLFKDAVNRSNKAFGENVALTNEANKRYETTESKLKMLRNEAVDAAIDMGGPFVDALRDGLQASKPLIKGLGDMAKSFSSLSEDQQRNIIKWVGIAAATGPALKLLGSGVSIIGKVTQSTGKLTGSLVELAAKTAEKKAMESFSATVTATGTAAAKTAGVGGLGGLTSALGQSGSAASAAAGSGGIGALTGSLGLLGPALLGIVGVGGALAIGYGAWKTFGEEAWNSSQRVKEWGSDVGTQVDSTLDVVKEKTLETSGQFGLMTEGFNQNTGPMVKNFETIGATIESSLTKKIEGLDNLIKNLPGSVTDSMKQIVENEKDMNQSALEKIQENNERIKEIREKSSKEHRDISVAEAQMISDLSKDTAEQYVNTLDVSAEQRKAILNSMTGDVANATKEQAETWLKSLGEQRNASKNHSAQMRKEQEKWLKEWGYNLDGEFAQKYLAEWDKINGATTDGFDSQIAAIVEKYPELTDKIHLATGEVIEASAGASQYLIEDNQKLLDNAGYMADKLAENAKKNANTLKWVAKEGTDGAKEWNSLELIDKEGNVKTNAPEIIKEASKNITTWNNLKMVLHDANIDSNAKKMIGEAAIANDLWRGMAWEDKEAVLQDEFSVNVYKALESSGKWDELNFEQKKAVLYSNTSEVMAETLFNLGLWDKYQPEIKNLNASNYDFLQTLSKSEEKLKVWNDTPVDIKELFAKNTDFLNKIFASEESFKQWNEIPDSEKKLLADNTDFLTKISTSKEALNEWNQLPNNQKKMLADNSDLLAKIFASKESFDAWKQIPDPVKHMLGDNVDVLSKVRDGTIKIDDYNKNVLPNLKILLGDSSNLDGTVNNATGLITNYNEKINPVEKVLNTSSNAPEVSSALDILNDSWNRIPEKSSKKINVDFIGPMPNAKGTNFHPGGSALVNDQKGPVYEEFIQLPNGQSFIPKGRNVVLDLPRGSKVLNATKTKRMLPRYADGVGNITAVSSVPNLDSLILALNELVAVLKTPLQNGNSSSSTDDLPNKANITEPLLPEDTAEKSDQYSSIGVDWLNNLMNGWNSAVPQFTASETLFISNYQNALKLQNTPNYTQGVTWNKSLMGGWTSLTATFIATINSFCNQAMFTLRNYNTPMYGNGRDWQQNNLNGWNSLYGSFVSRVNQLGNDSVNNLRSKSGDFYNAGAFLLQSLINGINSMGDPLNATMNSVANKMVGGIGKGVNGVISGVNYVLKEVESSQVIGNWAIPQYAKGTEGHPGGLAMINDQKGPVHEEYVQMPDGKGFIAKGRDLLVNLPKGAQVLNATLTKKLKNRLDVPRYENGIGNFDIVDLLDDEKAMRKFLNSKVNYDGINEPWLDMTKSGVNLMAKSANAMLQSKLSEFFTHGNFDGSLNGNGVYQYLVDVAQKVMSKFPGMTITSGYRPGDAYYHGKHQAIDIALPGVTGGSPIYTQAANYAFEKFPSKIAYVITNGKVRDRMGLSGTGASGSWVNWPDGDHFDHVHLNGAMGSGDIFNAGSASGNVDQWRSLATKALKMENQYNAANLNALLYQMKTESNGNPRAINLWDDNAKRGIPSKGLMQVIDPTFRSNARPGFDKDIYDPLSNILASIRYTKKTYGGLLAGWKGVGYADGGLINKDGLYRAGEGNKPEMVVPLTRKTRAIELMGQALAFLSGNEKKSASTNSVDNTNELVMLIKQQQEQHNELMMVLKAILKKDPNVKISDVGEAADSYLGSSLRRLQYTKA
ncbi:phage tail tape measure protein [Enterococcus durans]|uniref:phage tail tape measure protein n=1 Tax=Enterococcus durans TaxID=53345 RepID=UPI002018F8E5|nr:phage tail tape measure protein [Enterococcus durans]UQR05201.1 phage tail tape measure protein [Enterococcus durans]